MRLHRSVVSAALRGGVRGGEIVVVEADRETRYGSHPRGLEPLTARMIIHDARAWPALARRSIGFASSYMDGYWDCEDLVSLVRIAARDMPRYDALRRRLLPVVRPVQALRRRSRANTLNGSRHNVAAHYDLGNELFAAFLDESMTYSCAVFERPGMTLAEAQVAKLDRICRKLDLQPSDHLLEIGTGWGALAIHAARMYGCRVTTATISREQHAFATERVREAGLTDTVDVVLRDYRELSGRYDKLVSVEMIEAVGWQRLAGYFERLRKLTTERGLVLLQAITMADQAYVVEKDAGSFITDTIFPGGCVPSLGAIQRSGSRVGLRIVQLEDITPHYVETLRCWRERFGAAAEQLAAMGYDRPFRRMWDLYLAYCQAGFDEHRIQDVQILLAPPGFRAQPHSATDEWRGTARPDLRLIGAGAAR
jgi:cyclopropane-fatty-acyl-phospholipid synthase